jgi:hypothetical protein
MEITHQGKRYVIAGGRWRQQRDQERRQSRIDKAEAELKRLDIRGFLWLTQAKSVEKRGKEKSF